MLILIQNKIANWESVFYIQCVRVKLDRMSKVFIFRTEIYGPHTHTLNISKPLEAALNSVNTATHFNFLQEMGPGKIITAP